MSGPELPPRLPVDPDRFRHYRDVWWGIIALGMFLWGIVTAWHGLQALDWKHLYIGVVGMVCAYIMVGVGDA